MNKKVKLFDEDEDHKNNEADTSHRDTSENINSTSSFYKKQLEGSSGHVLLQLQKSYKGDSRFKLDERFEGDMDLSKHKLSSNVMGSMSKLESNQLVTSAPVESVMDSEKSKSFNILSQIVPAAEVYFKPSNTKKNNSSFNIKRFDPSKMNFCSHLLKSKPPAPVVKEAPAEKLKIVKNKEWNEAHKNIDNVPNVGKKVVDVDSEWSKIANKKKKNKEVINDDFVLDFGDDDGEDQQFSMGIKMEFKQTEQNDNNAGEQEEQEEIKKDVNHKSKNKDAKSHDKKRDK